MKTWFISTLLSVAFVAGFLYFVSDHPPVRKALNEWHRNEYLSHEIRLTKTRFVEEFISKVVSPRVISAEAAFGPSINWIDAPSKNRLDCVSTLAKSNPDEAFARACYVLTLAHTAKRAHANEPAIKVILGQGKFPVFSNYRDRHSDGGKTDAEAEATGYKLCMDEATIVTTANRLDKIVSPGGFHSSQLVDSSESAGVTPVH